MTGLIIALVLVLLISGVGVYIYIEVRKKVHQITNQVQSMSTNILGTPDVIKGLKQIEMDERNTPLSISGGDSIYLPLVQKDFPDFHKSVMEDSVKKFLIRYFRCLETKSDIHLKGLDLKDSMHSLIESEIADLISTNSSKQFDNIKFHTIAISRYVKTQELATVTYQVALEYVDGIKNQTKYELQYTFAFKDTSIESFAMRCPHCGGPVDASLLNCAYCGTQIVRNIEKVWRLSSYNKVK